MVQATDLECYPVLWLYSIAVRSLSSQQVVWPSSCCCKLNLSLLLYLFLALLLSVLRLTCSLLMGGEQGTVFIGTAVFLVNLFCSLSVSWFSIDLCLNVYSLSWMYTTCSNCMHSILCIIESKVLVYARSFLDLWHHQRVRVVGVKCSGEIHGVNCFWC